MNRTRSIAAALTLLVPLLTLTMAFQNCAQPVVPESSKDNSSLGQATPTPYPYQPTPPPYNYPTNPTGPTGWEGTCIFNSNTEPMSYNGGVDSGYGVLTAFTKGEWAALWFHAQGVQTARVCKMNETGWSMKGLAEVDGYYPKDVVWRNSDGRIAIWRMYGSQRVYGSILANRVSSDWKLEGALDANGDGKEDLLFRHADGRLQIWQMHNDSVAAASDIGSVPSTWHVRGLADFDGDGKEDILIREAAGQMRIYFMNGFAIKANTQVTGPAANPNPTHGIKAAGDFDGDGKADLFFLNGAGEYFWWKMNGAVASQPAGNYPTWTFLAHGDALVTPDGTMDMILTGVSGGQNYVFTQTMGNLTPAVKTGLHMPIQPGWTIFAFDRY